MRVNQAPSMLPFFTPQPPIPATGVSQTIIKQDQEKRETRGISETPDSSKKQMAALRRLAFFDPGPVTGDPPSDRLLVPLHRAASGTLQAPVQAMAQQPPHVRGVVAHPGEAPNDRCDA